MHFITGGNDHAQRSEGDTLTKDQRYARTRETEELARERARRTLAAIRQRRAAAPEAARCHQPERPENTGAQRLIAIAEQAEHFDRALWTPTAAATGGEGNSNALVGTPETVARALLDYYDLGVDILSARGYDLLGAAIDFGRHVIPLVREKVARRDREGTPRGPQGLPRILARLEDEGAGRVRAAG